MMLRHLGLAAEAQAIHDSCLAVIREGKFRTGDLGGRASTTDFVSRREVGSPELALITSSRRHAPLTRPSQTAAICEKVAAATK